jgi:hypothetical protein
MRPDGTNARQITQDLGNCRSPNYQSTLYTLVSNEPWYQLTFVSDASGTLTDDGSAPDTDLFSCKLDGSAVRRLTFNLSSDMDPYIMSDGRVLFAGWQRATLTRGDLGRIALCGVATDGTDYALLADTRGARIKHMPCTTDNGLVVFVEADSVPWDGAGTLASVKMRRPLQSYEPITRPSDGLFHSPSPLSNGSVLVSRRPSDGSGTHGVYRLDTATGRADLIFDDPRFHDIQACLVTPREEPDGRSSVVDEDDPHGVMYCLNVHVNDLPDRTWLQPGTVKRLRVLEGVPLSRDSSTAAPMDRDCENAGCVPLLARRRVLGEIDVATDGSFNIEIPANLPIELQLLDSRGMALRTCSWIWAKNKEPRGCIGCHEDGELTPENLLVDAVGRESIPLCLPADRRRTVDFRNHVMPIVEDKCIGCHKQGGDPPRLDGVAIGPDGQARPTPAYQNLMSRVTRTPEAHDPYGYQYVHPGSARTSPLIWHLFGRNTSRPWDGSSVEQSAKSIPEGHGTTLTEDEERTFIEWIDMGAMWDGNGAGRQSKHVSIGGGD